MVPTLTLGDYRVNINDFSKDLENNFQKFYDAYEETWTNKEKKDILKQHESFLNNLRAGNIVSIKIVSAISEDVMGSMKNFLMKTHLRKK